MIVEKKLLLSQKQGVGEKIRHYNARVYKVEVLNNRLVVVRSFLQHIIEPIGICQNSTIVFYGSAVNMFGSTLSDTDCQINLQNNDCERAFTEVVTRLKLSQATIISYHQNRARVPVLTFRLNKCECDITFTGPANRRTGALKNTKMLKSYHDQHSSIGNIFRFIKHLFSKTHLFSAKMAAISSYAHTTMFLCYLVKYDKCDQIDVKTLKYTTTEHEWEAESTRLYGYMQFLATLDGRTTFDLSSNNTVSTTPSNTVSIVIRDPYEDRDLAKQISQSNLYYLRVACRVIITEIFGPMRLTKPQLKRTVDRLPKLTLKYARTHGLHDPIARRFEKHYRLKI